MHVYLKVRLDDFGAHEIQGCFDSLDKSKKALKISKEEKAENYDAAIVGTGRCRGTTYRRGKAIFFVCSLAVV